MLESDGISINDCLVVDLLRESRRQEGYRGKLVPVPVAAVEVKLHPETCGSVVPAAHDVSTFKSSHNFIDQTRPSTRNNTPSWCATRRTSPPRARRAPMDREVTLNTPIPTARMALAATSDHPSKQQHGI